MSSTSGNTIPRDGEAMTLEEKSAPGTFCERARPSLVQIGSASDGDGGALSSSSDCDAAAASPPRPPQCLGSSGVSWQAGSATSYASISDSGSMSGMGCGPSKGASRDASSTNLRCGIMGQPQGHIVQATCYSAEAVPPGTPAARGRLWPPPRREPDTSPDRSRSPPPTMPLPRRPADCASPFTGPDPPATTSPRAGRPQPTTAPHSPAIAVAHQSSPMGELRPGAPGRQASLAWFGAGNSSGVTCETDDWKEVGASGPPPVPRPFRKGSEVALLLEGVTPPPPPPPMPLPPPWQVEPVLRSPSASGRSRRSSPRPARVTSGAARPAEGHASRGMAVRTAMSFSRGPAPKNRRASGQREPGLAPPAEGSADGGWSAAPPLTDPPAAGEGASCETLCSSPPHSIAGSSTLVSPRSARRSYSRNSSQISLEYGAVPHQKSFPDMGGQGGSIESISQGRSTTGSPRRVRQEPGIGSAHACSDGRGAGLTVSIDSPALLDEAAPLLPPGKASFHLPPLVCGAESKGASAADQGAGLRTTSLLCGPRRRAAAVASRGKRAGGMCAWLWRWLWAACAGLGALAWLASQGGLVRGWGRPSPSTPLFGWAVRLAPA
eukprot:scaffold458_cov101-Isochrysis_galbana.AAC.2